MLFKEILRDYFVVSYNFYRSAYFLPWFFLSFFFFIKFFFSSDAFESWMLSFQDPATIYALAFMDLHDLTMWYVFLVLGLVCWCLYVALKNGVWRVASKGFGLSRIFYFFVVFSYVESFVSFIWSKLSLSFYKFLYDLFSKESTIFSMICFSLGVERTIYNELLYFFCGSKRFISGVSFPRFLHGFTFSDVFFLVREKYLDFYLFSISTYCEFFYDDFSPLLNIRRFRHSLLLEIIWATFPTVIIALILVPSLYLLYSSEEELNPEITLKVMGHQWFWSYEYSDFFDFSFGSFSAKEYRAFGFDSYLVLEDDLTFGSKRLLEVNNRVVLPTNIVLRFLITSGDVLHSWAVPEMGIKVDAVPGRLNQCLSFILRPGVFYGQCSELCGVAHGFMPIVVHAVSPEEFNFWIFWSI